MEELLFVAKTAHPRFVIGPTRTHFHPQFQKHFGVQEFFQLLSCQRSDVFQTLAAFAVTLSAPSGLPVTVGYATADGTATAGSDYLPASGTLTFAPGVTSQTVPVTIVGDATYEADETFVVVLSQPAGAVLGTSQATGTISNDDALPALSIASASRAEGNAGSSPLTFTITLSPASGLPVTVAYASIDGTATAGSDYAAGSGSLTFAPGTTMQTVSVSVTGDKIGRAHV